MTNNILTPMATLMVAMSLITLYYYLKICYSSFLILNAEPKWNTQMQKNYSSSHIMELILNKATLSGMILCTTLNNMM